MSQILYNAAYNIPPCTYHSLALYTQRRVIYSRYMDKSTESSFYSWRCSSNQFLRDYNLIEKSRDSFFESKSILSLCNTMLTFKLVRGHLRNESCDEKDIVHMTNSEFRNFRSSLPNVFALKTLPNHFDNVLVSRGYLSFRMYKPNQWIDFESCYNINKYLMCCEQYRTEENATWSENCRKFVNLIKAAASHYKYFIKIY